MNFKQLLSPAVCAAVLAAAPAIGHAAEDKLSVSTPVMTEQNQDAMFAAWKGYGETMDKHVQKSAVEKQVAAEIMAAHEGLIKAVDAHDAKQIAKYISPDFTLVLGTGNMFNAPDRIAWLAGGHPPFETSPFITSNVRVMDKDNAVVTAALSYTQGGTPTEKIRYGVLRGIFVFHRAAEGWQIVAAQALRTPVQPPKPLG